MCTGNFLNQFVGDVETMQSQDRAQASSHRDKLFGAFGLTLALVLVLRVSHSAVVDSTEAFDAMSTMQSASTHAPTLAPTRAFLSLRGNLVSVVVRALIVASGILCGCVPNSRSVDGERVVHSVEDCSAEALHAALDAAQPGDTVLVGPCRIAGSFFVSAEVTLQGSGVSRTTLVGLPSGPAVELVPNEGEPTALSEITIEGHGSEAVLARGPGDILVANAAVVGMTGAGIRSEGVTNLLATNVTLQGPVTEKSAAGMIGPELGSTDGAGVVSECGETVVLQSVDIVGFAGCGAFVAGGELRWEGGGAIANLGIGLCTLSADVTLRDIDLSETFVGVGLLSYAGVFADGGDIHSERLRVERNGMFGLVHDGVTALHEDLVASQNADAALWSQNRSAITIERGTLYENRHAGLVAVAPGPLTVRDTFIGSSELVTRIWAETQPVEVGDGIMIAGPLLGRLVFENLLLLSNRRVGAIIDLNGGAMGRTTIENVVVFGTGNEHGFIVQNGTVPDAWDRGVARFGAAATNDATYPGHLRVPTAERPRTGGVTHCNR